MYGVERHAGDGEEGGDEDCAGDGGIGCLRPDAVDWEAFSTLVYLLVYVEGYGARLGLHTLSCYPTSPQHPYNYTPRKWQTERLSRTRSAR